MKASLFVAIVMTVVALGCVRTVPVYQTAPRAMTPMVSPMAMAPMAPMASGTYLLPPIPPQDVAFVNGHGYPNEWRQTHLVRIRNRTDYCVAVRMDGVHLQVADQMVPLPCIPPRSEAHLYAPLDRTDLHTGCEWHHFEFDAYLAPNFDRPVARDAQEKPFCAGWDYQPVEISSLCMSGYC